mmetsp:Transcript_6653/g.10478  ORF Transcript_6653/g.10478 Transcript_6653/m.10478 type:complete len:163 (+) Transcript_6653:61-549(+)|eukprot:CAMPEP_0203753796 /NCGR_PEP_ID=MMETSP0098-20131031/7508_1 /ASSEMBLY_ACC=CAM_ASM_000208 /TAXON_ID=96639 /ORGANISM=" , Strain NY0313808BC1" /LENGTH=162 /DNA_ID=CAMNT_0050644547 /DNA_START=42 /DNA_END=530 /DNA_ORIENTATION=+
MGNCIHRIEKCGFFDGDNEGKDYYICEHGAIIPLRKPTASNANSKYGKQTCCDCEKITKKTRRTKPQSLEDAKRQTGEMNKPLPRQTVASIEVDAPIVTHVEDMVPPPVPPRSSDMVSPQPPPRASDIAPPPPPPRASDMAPPPPPPPPGAPLRSVDSWDLV